MAKKRRTRTPLQIAKDSLWSAIRDYIFKKHGHECYTCGSPNAKHVGHYPASVTLPQRMRFWLDILRPQCFYCNKWRQGNWLRYYIRMEAEEPGVTQRVAAQFVRTHNEETPDLDWYEEAIRNVEEATRGLPEQIKVLPNPLASIWKYDKDKR